MSAHLAGMIIEPISVQPLTAEQLAVLFGFTPDDLAQNRAGAFSARQRQQLGYQSIGYLLRGVGFLILSAILTANLLPDLDAGWQYGLLALVGGLIVCTGAYLFFAAYRVFSPQVLIAEGRLTRSGNAQQPVVLIADRTLRISYRRWKRLPASFPGPYRVYYARTVDTLLSIEPVCEG